MNLNASEANVLLINLPKVHRTEITQLIKEITSRYGREPIVLSNIHQALQQLRDSEFEYDVVILHQTARDGDVWRLVLNETKEQNRFSELIVVISDNDKSVTASEVIRAGSFAYFEYSFVPDVLLGYIDGARARIQDRKARIHFAGSINHVETLKDISEVLLTELRGIVEWDFATLVLFDQRDYFDPIGESETEKYTSRLVRSLQLHQPDSSNINWKLLRPLRDDQLILEIVSGKRTQRIYPDVKQELGDLWDSRVQSLLTLILGLLCHFTTCNVRLDLLLWMGMKPTSSSSGK